jgi:hypothetical protein
LTFENSDGQSGHQEKKWANGPEAENGLTPLVEPLFDFTDSGLRLNCAIDPAR